MVLHTKNLGDKSVMIFLCPWDFPGRILERVAISFSRESSWARDQTCISCISCMSRWVLYCCTTIKTQFHPNFFKLLFYKKDIVDKILLFLKSRLVILKPKQALLPKDKIYLSFNNFSCSNKCFSRRRLVCGSISAPTASASFQDPDAEEAGGEQGEHRGGTRCHRKFCFQFSTRYESLGR